MLAYIDFCFIREGPIFVKIQFDFICTCRSAFSETGAQYQLSYTDGVPFFQRELYSKFPLKYRENIEKIYKPLAGFEPATL